MLKMMKLDYFSMKPFWIRIFLQALIPFALILFNVPLFVLPTMAFVMQDAAFYTFTAEEKGKLHHLYMTLPINRKIIVRTRFVLVLVFLSVGIIFGTALILVSSTLLYGRTIIFKYTFNPDFNAILLLISVSLLVCAIVNFASLPLLLKFGYSKAKFIGYYLPSYSVMILISAIIVISYRVEALAKFIFSSIEMAINDIVWTAVILIGVAVLVFALTYLLSQRVYDKREF